MAFGFLAFWLLAFWLFGLLPLWLLAFQLLAFWLLAFSFLARWLLAFCLLAFWFVLGAGDVCLTECQTRVVDGFSMVEVDCGALESQFVRLCSSADMLNRSDMPVFDIDSPVVRSAFRANKHRQGWSLHNHFLFPQRPFLKKPQHLCCHLCQCHLHRSLFHGFPRWRTSIRQSCQILCLWALLHAPRLAKCIPPWHPLSTAAWRLRTLHSELVQSIVCPLLGAKLPYIY